MAEEVWPSLDVVEKELDRSSAEQFQRASALDTKAGLLLGFAGVMIALGPDAPGYLDVISQAGAVSAAFLAAWALWPQSANEVGPTALRDNYVDKSPILSRSALYATRAEHFDQNEVRLKTKVKRMRGAMSVLVASTVLSVGSTILDLQADDPGEQSQLSCVVRSNLDPSGLPPGQAELARQTCSVVVDPNLSR